MVREPADRKIEHPEAHLAGFGRRPWRRAVDLVPAGYPCHRPASPARAGAGARTIRDTSARTSPGLAKQRHQTRGYNNSVGSNSWLLAPPHPANRGKA